MTFLYYGILVLHIVACLFLIAVVLLQQGKGQDLASAFGGGGTQTAFGPRGSANVLSRATTILAGVFMVSSLGLSLVKPRQGSILDSVAAPAASPSPAASAKPNVPAAASPASSPAAAAPSPAAPAATPGAGPSPSSPAPK
jgi:preprotein translocase subunit SecG